MTLLPTEAIETVLDPRPDSTWLIDLLAVQSIPYQISCLRILAAPTVKLLALVLDRVNIAVGLADADDKVSP